MFSMHTLMPVKAISTLLQPPIARTGRLPHAAAPASSAYKPPTALDIPPVTIAHVDAAEFKPYLIQIGAFYEQLRRVEGSENEAAANLHKRSGETDGFAVVLHDGSLRPGKRRPATRESSVPPASSSLPIEVEVPSPKRATQGLPPLTTIPAVYVDADFHLENPRTFDVVTERSEVVPPRPGTLGEKKVPANASAGAPRKTLATHAILQEKLSWYIDTVEVHLIASISLASTSFSAALGSLREIHTEVADPVERVKALRKKLDVLDQEIAIHGDTVQKRQ